MSNDRAPHWRNHAPPCAIAFLTLLALLAAIVPAASAQSFNCARATTAVERGVCADPALRKLDTVLGEDFSAALAATQGAIKRSLLAQQRSWLEQRDRVCQTGAPACLTPLYRSRIDVLSSLTARISPGNPNLDDVTAVALLGPWSVNGYLVPGQPDRQVSAADKPSYLPDTGTTVTGRPGQICDQDGECLTFGLDAQTLASVLIGNQVEAALHLPATTPFYVVYLSGKTEYGLIPRPDGSLLAQFILCDARFTKCGIAFQRWTPGSPAASLRVLAP